MVRMDVCVEALYDKNGITERGRTLQMLKVMKGAISVSKSRTGECIFRSNKLERRNLERTIRCYKKDCDYVAARYDSQKKLTTQRFMKLLDRQNSFSCQELFADLLDVKSPPLKRPDTSKPPGEDPLLKLLELRLQRPEAGVSGFGLQKISQNKPKETTESIEKKDEDMQEPFVTEKKDIRSKYTDLQPAANKAKPNVLLIPPPSPAAAEQVRTTVHGTVLGRAETRAKLPVLPPIVGTGRNKRPIIQKADGEVGRKPDDGNEERDLTDWKEWRLNDKECFLDYIYRQKTRHDDLIMRNALVRIRTEMSEGNSIHGYRVRQKLQEETIGDSCPPTRRSNRHQKSRNGPNMSQVHKESPGTCKTNLGKNSETQPQRGTPDTPHNPATPAETRKSILKSNLEKGSANRSAACRQLPGHKTVRIERPLLRTAPGGLKVILESPPGLHVGQFLALPAERADTTI